MKTETLIVRNVRSPRMYDVVQADFTKGQYTYLKQYLTFEQARDCIREITGCIEDEYTDNISPVIESVF